jgi:hypothetical protein
MCRRPSIKRAGSESLQVLIDREQSERDDVR